MLVYVAGLVDGALSWRSIAAREAGHGEYYSMLLGSISGMVVLAAAADLITLFVGLELLSIPLYVLCATELRRRTSLEAGLKYLVVGSVGSATLLYGLALIYGATGAMRLRRDLGGDRRTRVEPDRPAAADRHRADGDRPGLQGLGRAVPPVDAGRLPGRAHPDHDVHGGRDEGGGVRRVPPPVRPRARAVAAPMGARARGAGGDDDRDRQRRRAAAALAQTACSPGRASRRPATPGRRGGGRPSWACRRRSSTWPSTW